jgi:hypothetical protein
MADWLDKYPGAYNVVAGSPVAGSKLCHFEDRNMRFAH